MKPPTCWMCGKTPKFWQFPERIHLCSDDCFNKFKAGEKPMKFVKQVKVPSQTDPKKSYTVSFDAKGNASCSCKRWVSTSPRVDCKHIKSVQSGKKLQSKEKVMAAAKKARKNRKSIVEAPTTRGTLIRLLMKQKNKLVAMKAIYAEVKKVKGWDDDKRVQSKVKAVISSVKAWAGQHDFKLVTSSNGLKLQSE